MISLRESAERVAEWLARHVDDGGFPARTFYGESFALWLWGLFPDEFAAQEEALRAKAVAQAGRCDSQSHPEFNLWALLHYQTSNAPLAPPHWAEARFRNTPKTNWILLGTLVRLLMNRSTRSRRHFSEPALRCHLRILLASQQHDGLLRDDALLSRALPIRFPYSRGSKWALRFDPRRVSLSLQYHAFSLALLWDIYELTSWPEARRAFASGVSAILPFVLPNGDTLYLGRGKQQIFGYAALLYALSAAAHRLHDPEAHAALLRVWEHVASFQRQDGSFPLILRQREEGYPATVDTADPRWCGWYSYNNYFDYLPLLGVFLARASELGRDWDGAAAERPRRPTVPPTITTRGEYVLIEGPSWRAALAAPVGVNASDQPIPYLCVDGYSLLPCFGGEEYEASTYSLSALPLPYLVATTGEAIYLRDALRWSLHPSADSRSMTLAGTGSLGAFTRTLSWEAGLWRFSDSLSLTATALRRAAALKLVHFAAFGLARLGAGRYHVTCPGRVHLELRVSGTCGQLSVRPAFCPTGSIEVLEETISAVRSSRPRLDRSMVLALQRDAAQARSEQPQW